jgi:hypothetical protein
MQVLGNVIDVHFGTNSKFVGKAGILLQVKAKFQPLVAACCEV